MMGNNLFGPIGARPRGSAQDSVSPRPPAGERFGPPRRKPRRRSPRAGRGPRPVDFGPHRSGMLRPFADEPTVPRETLPHGNSVADLRRADASDAHRHGGRLHG